MPVGDSPAFHVFAPSLVRIDRAIHIVEREYVIKRAP
eukprot:COSAG02_NODE_53113_length_303_cov_15.867647_1_plen_36_part_10